ncbi:MAG TPA: WecB/TagA/CpsF family glycosyltransferase [Candidatus Dormibacteraeota bacterium]|nr:WecB/TagA/CpsF family glycosyltransferase [Candidatus Dormibacteraeota bacterium]
MPERVNVLGVAVSAINMQMALAEIESWIERRERHYVCVCPVHSVMECRRSDEVRRIFNAAGMVTPDGMPIVWTVRASGHPEAARVYGPDLMLALAEQSLKTRRRHFFYGGGPGVAERLVQRLQARFPGLDVVGAYEPPFAPLDELCTDATAALIDHDQPDIVWVGISSPKQDRWMACMRPRLNAPVIIGVGAAFDFHSGTVRQAPLWMQRSGLEWLFRLGTDPRRLWKRYAVDNPWFVWELFLQLSGLKKFELG